MSIYASILVGSPFLSPDLKMVQIQSLATEVQVVQKAHPRRRSSGSCFSLFLSQLCACTPPSLILFSLDEEIPFSII